MGCFLTCFGGAKDRKRRRPPNKSPPVDRVCESYKPLRNPSSKQLTLNLSPKKLISEAVVGSTPESRDNDEQGSFGSSKKKVTFDLNVKTYEEVLVDEDPKHSSEDTRENEVIREERKPEEADDESLLNSGASLLNHRYQNCEGSDDDDDIDYGEEEEDEDEDYEDIDLDEDDGNVVDIEGNEEESNASFLLLEVEKEQQSIQEVNSSKSKSVSPDRQPPLLAKGTARDRSQYVHPVLNPVENLTQWREVKVRAAPSKNRKKENINSDIENKITFSPEPTFKIEGRLRTNCPAQHDATVDASLSNWLVSSDNSDKERPHQSNSDFSKLSVGQEERPTSGVLTVEDIKQSSVTSSLRRSPSRSPDEIPIVGTVGGCGSWKNQRSDSGSSCQSGSTIKGIPNATSTYRKVCQVLERNSFKYEL